MTDATTGLATQVAQLEQIASVAIELNRLAKLAYSDRDSALDALSELAYPPELSFLQVAVLEHIALQYKPERQPRTAVQPKAVD